MDALKRHLVRLTRAETGAELIEFAIALPILMLVAAGIMDFGILFQRYEVVTNAAREGARVAILPGYGIPDIQARVNTYLLASGLNNAAPVPDVAYETVEVTPGGNSMDVVTVTVQYPHEFLFLSPVSGLIGGGPHGDLMLAAASTMRLEVAAAP
jgi:Flp pilus assembly protein TadG